MACCGNCAKGVPCTKTCSGCASSPNPPSALGIFEDQDQTPLLLVGATVGSALVAAAVFASTGGAKSYKGAVARSVAAYAGVVGGVVAVVTFLISREGS